MAKLFKPLHSLSALGALGKELTIRGRGKSRIMEKKPIPRDAKTSAQLAWRTMYQLAIDLWHALSTAEKQEWESSATPRHMTGFAWFMSQALRPNPGLYLPLLGGTMQGDIDMDGHDILNYAPGAGTWELIDDHLFAAQATSYSVIGLDGNADKIYKIFVFLVRNVALDYQLLLRPNNDGGGNYTTQALMTWGAVVTGAYVAGMTGLTVAHVQSDCDVSWCPAQYLYAPTGYNRQMHGYRNNDFSPGVGSPIWYSHFSTWQNPAANITSLVFVANQANGIGAGSRIVLYKMVSP